MAKSAKTKAVAVAASIAVLIMADAGRATGTLNIAPVDPDFDALVATVTKGAVKGSEETENYCFFVSLEGETTATFASEIDAVNAALVAAGLDVAEYAFDVAAIDWKAAGKGHNKPPKPTTIDDLGADVQATIRTLWDESEKAASVITKAIGSQRAGTVALSLTIRAARDAIMQDDTNGKFAWGIATNGAPENSMLKTLATSKNALMDYVKLGGLPKALIDAAPAQLSSASSIMKWVTAARSGIATAVVETIKGDAELQALAPSDAIAAVFKDHNEGLTTLTGADKSAQVVLDLHAENIGKLQAGYPAGSPVVSADSGGSWFTPKVQGMKYYSTAPLVSTEGADELLSAICKGMNSYKAPVVVEAEKEERQKAKALVDAMSGFQDWSVERVAFHLFTVLAGRVVYDEADSEGVAVPDDETSEFVGAVSDVMAGMVADLVNGERTFADIKSAVMGDDTAPESEDDAESEGDADA